MKETNLLHIAMRSTIPFLHPIQNMIVRIKHIPILIGTLPKNGSPVLEINNIREIPQNYHTFALRSLIPSKIARIHDLKSTWHSPDVLV